MSATDLSSGDNAISLVVLVVEDDPSMMPFIRAALASFGHRITTADSVSEALERVYDFGFSIDALLVDLKLSDGDGREVAEAAKVMRPSTPVVFMSGSSEALSEVEDSQLTSTVLRKPFEVAELQRALIAAVRDAAS